MSVDENSRNPIRNPTTALPPSFRHVSSSTADDHSSRKVKLLCSFDGKILPRPSDGVLRYAGGQTRLITVSRDATLPEIYRKLADAYGGPVTIRYQLPDEDLDALISVSSAEDLDNMLEEYDKLAEAFGDGSAKLRVFLFPPFEIGSSAAEISSAEITGTDPYDSGQRYIEAINGVGTCGIRRKDSTASATSTQNSDVVGNGSNNEGTSPTVDSPSVAVTGSHNSWRVSSVGNANSATEYQCFPANSTVDGHTKEAAQVLNPPPVVPYASQAYVESQQVQYITPHSLSMAGGPRFLNVFNVPRQLYLPPMHIPPLSVPSHVGNQKQVHGTVEPYLEGNQNGGRVLQFVPDQNYMVFGQPFSQFPLLNPSNMQPQSVEQYGSQPLPQLPKGQGLGLEDCQMCQEALPHAHPDSVINEQGNLSGISTSEANPALHAHHSVDITKLQPQHREVSVVMTENKAEPKIESIVIPGQFGAYGVNHLSDKILEKEKLVVPNTENLDHYKSKQPQDLLGFSGDTETSYGAFVNSSRPHHKGKLLLQEQHVLHGEHFGHSKFLHLPATIDLSSTSHASHAVSLSPPQPFHEDSLQQKMVLPAEQFNHAMDFRPSGIMGLTGAAQTSYGLFLKPPQLYHEESVQNHHHQQQQLLQTTVPPPFAVKQDVFQKQLVQGSSSMENREYQGKEPLGNSVHVFSHGYVKPMDGMMEALHASSFETLRLNEQLKPVVPEVSVSKDMEPGKSSMVGEQNHVMRPQNGANQLLSSNTFANPGIVPEGFSVGPVDPMFSNIGISKDVKPDISSVVGAENNSLRSHNDGNALLLGNASLSPGIPPEVNSLRLINPLLSSMVHNMHPHNCQSANTTHISTSAANHGQFSQNFESNVEPSIPHYLMPGITPCHTTYGYRNVINESLDGERKDKASVVNSKDLDNDKAAFPRGNVPFQCFHSNCTPEHMEQLVETSASDSLFCNQDPWKVIGSAHMSPPRPTILASSEPVSKDMFIENPLPNSNIPDIAVLLEEGTLQLHVDHLNKDSCPEPFQATRGADYVQDLHELVEQVVESVLQSSLTSAPASYSLEPSSTFPIWTRISEDMVNSNSITEVGDQKLEIKKSDKVHSGVPHADDIGRLQIIKNIDLEELRELGSGTFGTVFHGKWRGSDVAIKRLNDRCFTGKPSEQERMRADFWNEASKLADLHHPNVVAFYGIVLDGPGGSFATVTEYMVNGSLRNALQSNEKTLDQRKRLLIATEVAFGMEYLHEKNIVHFDLKSDNLLVNLRDSQRPICKVGDLGLSKVKCKTLISGGVRGTLPWMAPELLNGSSSLVSEKVDVFSFGMVMWELLTGQEPYADLHYGAIIGGIVNNTLRPTVPESCDPEWKSLMEQCWSAEPSGRPSFTEIASRLRFMAASLSNKLQAPSI